MNEGFGSIRHLAARFFGALDPRGPSAALEAWAQGFLLAGERELWMQMSGPDRRHAAGVARKVASLLNDGGPAPDRTVMAAALLHDVGKLRCGLGTFSRVAVTLAAMSLGRERLAEIPPEHRRWRARVGEYLTHDRIGEEMLSRAGSAALTSTWAGEHHRNRQSWVTPPRIAAALNEADGD